MTTTYSLTGKVTGPLSALSAEGRRFLDSGQSFDFAVGGLPFRLCSTDDTPYARETAQYRKDQFDAASVPGDQSLSGWWLRSQFSFHKGMGVKYYEVLDGETIINRFYQGNDILINRVGEVSLAPETKSVTVAGIVDTAYVVNPAFTTFYRLIRTTSGSLLSQQEQTDITTSTATVVATSDGGACSAFTHSFSTVWLINGNKIEYWKPGMATSIVVYTMTDATITWKGVFYLKGRLWAVDSRSNWFMLTADVVAANKAAVDSFGAPGEKLRFFDWSATETPTAVLASVDNRVYQIGLDESASVPTPLPPVLVASLPDREAVTSIAYSLGSVVMTTVHGCRFGVVQGSQLIYGSLVGDADFSKCIRPTVSETRIYVPGVASDGNFVYTFDLANQVSDLVPAVNREFSISTGASGKMGCRSTNNGITFWSETANRLYRSSDVAYSTPVPAPTGVLTTGFHRYGTLEPKQFHSVRVRVSGTGGSVAVSRVMRDGSVIQLLSIDVTKTDTEDISLGLTSPEEMLGLRFTLSRSTVDPTKSPVLLGYQLRALPAPRRQRMLKVPLLIQDTIRNRMGVDRGRRDQAWENLRALEDLESQVALTTFMDYRTGESGLAYIESVSFQSNTPVSRNDGGFGGVAYVQLRVV